MRVAVFGATGLVGATVVQRLRLEPEMEVLPLIHSTGRAWRLARLGISMETGDVMKPGEIDQRLKGVTHVVNCSRGPREVMIDGFKNLLGACRRAGVARLVHLSSVSAYGDLAPGENITETQAQGKLHSGYAKIKAEQDKLVDAEARRGLDCISLCPPMIVGPYSGFILDILKALRKRTFALVDDGRYPCPTADVGNVAHAIVRALVCKTPVRGRVFITDGAAPSWRELAEALLPFANLDQPLPTVSLDEAQKLIDAAEQKSASIRGSLKHLASSKVRAVLREDPFFARTETLLKRMAGMLPASAINRLRSSNEGAAARSRPKSKPRWNTDLMWRQMRRLSFSIDKARTQLEYEPFVDFAGSMAAFSAWYMTHSGFGGENWDLLSKLEASGAAAAG